MGHLYYHILSLETSHKKEKYKSCFEFSFDNKEQDIPSCRAIFTFIRRDYSVSENIEVDDRFINEVFLSGKDFDSVPALRITNTESRVRSYLKDLSEKERITFDKEYQKYKDKNKDVSAPLLRFINSDSKAAFPLRKIIIEKVVNKSDYTRIPKDYLGTLGYSLDMAQIDSLCRNQYKDYFTEGDLAFKTVRVSEAKDNCLGFTPAVITLTISKKYRCSLYEQGFNLIYGEHTYHYERYKRSASNARNRQCIFIVDSVDGKSVVNAKGKTLKENMYEWSNCGLKNPYTDPASWEAYSALTLSGIEKDLITLDRKSILLINDKKSQFYDKKGCSPVYYGEDEDGEPILNIANQNSSDDLFLINNTIWDGQALLDESVFAHEDNEAYKDAHFVLLRSKFFKSCAFKTKLQKWFYDNGINSVSQLKGYTMADDISDIKLVITESSLKYLKFYEGKGKCESKDAIFRDGFETWLKENSCKRKDKNKNTVYEIDFGVVKTDHPSSGKIKTSYQYLNSIGITEKQAKAFTEAEIERLASYLESPKAFGDYLKGSLRGMSLDSSKTDADDEDIEMLVDNVSYGYQDYQYQSASIARLIDITEDCKHLKVYKDFLADQIEKMVEHLLKGRISIDGIYATLFGNPAEYLYSTIYDYDPNSSSTYYYNVDGVETKLVTLKKNHVCCKNRVFNNGDKLVGARYPHVTMGNLYVTRNENNKDSFYDQYFDIGEEVVCINSINNNILHQLNGADFDSDTMMITNNPTIYIAAKRQRDYFKIPVNQLIEENDVNDNITTEEDYPAKLASVDEKLNGSALGEIINLASYLNGEFWAKYPVESWKEKAKAPDTDGTEAMDIYNAICRLAVLSGVVIDNAKKSTKCNIYKEKVIARELKNKSRIVEAPNYNRIKEIPVYYRESILKSENQKHKYDEKPKGKDSTISKYIFNYLLAMLSDECIKYKIFDSFSRKLELEKEDRVTLYYRYIGDNTGTVEQYDKLSKKYEKELNSSNIYYTNLYSVMDMTDEQYMDFLKTAYEKIEITVKEISLILSIETPKLKPYIFDFTTRENGKKVTYKPMREDEQRSFMGYINRFVTEENNKVGKENRLRKSNIAKWAFKDLFIELPPDEELEEKEKEKLRHILNLIVDAQMYINEMQYDIRKGFNTQYDAVGNRVSSLRKTIRDYLGEDSSKEKKDKVVHRSRMIYELINKVDDAEYKKCRRLLVAMILDEKVMTKDMEKVLVNGGRG